MKQQQNGERGDFCPLVAISALFILCPVAPPRERGAAGM